MNRQEAIQAEDAIRKIFYGICEKGVHALRTAPHDEDRFCVEITRWKNLSPGVYCEIRTAFAAGAGRLPARGDVVFVPVKPLVMRKTS